MSRSPSAFPEGVDVDAVKRERDPALVERIVAGGFEGDPAADRLIAAFRSLPGGAGWKMLEQALASPAGNVAGAPPELRALLKPLLRPPAWVDFELADAGALAFWRVGAVNLQLALTCGSLAYGYQSARLVRPLAATGRLEQMASRRLGETSRWVLEATAPGGMHVGSDGFRATVRLRLVHALVRDHLLRSGAWDLDAWGVPISASDSMVTATGGFFLVPMRAMEDLGVRFTPAEREAVTHLWRWIGYVVGVPEDMLPGSYAEARELIETALALDSGPNEDSPKLMNALLFHGSGMSDSLPSFVARPLQHAMGLWLGGFTRRWMGDEMADQLEVPRTPLTHVAHLLRPVNAVRNAARATGLLGSDERIAEFELNVVRRFLAAGRAPAAALAPQDAAQEPVLKVA